MKHLIILSFLVLGMLNTKSASAQSYAAFSINEDDPHPEYYYLPDIDAYYYIPRRQYVYLDNGHWVFSAHVPQRYHDYDFEHGRKIYVNGSRPYLHHDAHYAEYRSHGKRQGYGNKHGNRQKKRHGNGY